MFLYLSHTVCQGLLSLHNGYTIKSAENYLTGEINLATLFRETPPLLLVVCMSVAMLLGVAIMVSRFAGSRLNELFRESGSYYHINIGSRPWASRVVAASPYILASALLIALEFLIVQWLLAIYWAYRSVVESGWSFAPALITVACFVLGLIVYSIRCRARLAYGMVEVTVGVLASYNSAQSFRTTDLIAFAAGLYVIVRGLDNVEKGIRGWPVAYPVWLRVFGRQV